MTGTTIVRRKHTANFVVVPNEVAQHRGMSFAARGLLLYLLSKPDDWEVQATDIQNEGDIGRHKAYQLLAELKKAGYAKRVQKRTSGRFEKSILEIYDFPMVEELPLFADPPRDENRHTVSPRDGFSDTVKPDTVEPHAVKPDTENRHTYKGQNDTKPRSLKNTHPHQNARASAREVEEVENWFHEIWNEWELTGVEMPESRSAAFNKFFSLPPELQQVARMQGKTHRRMVSMQERTPKLFEFLERPILKDLIDLPPMNEHGMFVIGPDDTPHRGAWLEWAEATNNEPAARVLVGLKEYITKNPKPPAKYETLATNRRWVAPFSPMWMAYRYKLLIDGFERERPKSTQMIEHAIANGNETVLAEQTKKHCWPTVNAMDRYAERGEGYPIPADFKKPDDFLTENMLVGSQQFDEFLEQWSGRAWPKLPTHPLYTSVWAFEVMMK